MTGGPHGAALDAATVLGRVAAAGGLAPLGLAWARVMPAVTLVPAFGLRALPVPARGVLGLAFAACIFPAVAPEVTGGMTGGPSFAPGSWAVQALVEAARGLPVAIAAAVPLWAATMAGGMADALRAATDRPLVPVVEGPATPMGIPLSLLASVVFLTTGGPARVVEALALHPLGERPLLAAAHDLAAGISLAVALGGPLLAAAVVIEVAGALVARAASPAQVHMLIAPLRALGALAVTGVVLERLAGALARAVASVP